MHFFTEERQNFLLGEQQTEGLKKKILAASLVNGVLYFAVAMDGGDNAESFLGLDGNAGDTAIFALSIGACLVYTMFMYKTIESLSLNVDSLAQGFFSFLAPFSAAAFLTGGKEGSELLGFSEVPALIIGISLFCFRTVNSVDASVKFPNRLSETKVAWNGACQTKDYAELSRLMTVWLASLAYVACTTDAIYNASEIIFGWMGLSGKASEPINFIVSGLGAVGTLPLNVYWSHRGLRQLTFGGQVNEEGLNPDPTDKYTYAGLVLVIPVILGILGGAAASTGKVFGEVGEAAQWIRICSSVLYGIFAGTPGMATLLRDIAKTSFDCPRLFNTREDASDNSYHIGFYGDQGVPVEEVRREGSVESVP